MGPDEEIFLEGNLQKPKTKSFRYSGIDLKDIYTKYGQSKLRNKNLATKDVLHVKPIVLYLLHVQ